MFDFILYEINLFSKCSLTLKGKRIINYNYSGIQYKTPAFHFDTNFFTIMRIQIKKTKIGN